MGEAESTRALSALLSDCWGITPASVEPFDAGRMNRHWRVETSVGAFVLRRYSRLRLPESIPGEQAVLEAAANAGWPVALPIASLADERIVLSASARYSLFPFLPGERAALGRLSQLRINGRLLARLHGDLAGALESQRPGYGRAWELDVTLQSAGADSFNAALSEFGKQHGELAAAVRRQRYRSLRELSRLGYGDLPSSVIHGGFHNDNLLFSGPELTGLLDFDSARRDAPMVDLAISLIRDCTLPPDHNVIDPVRVGAMLEGYSRTRRPQTTELEMLPALLRAAILMLVAHRLAEWKAGASDRAVASIERSVAARFPALDEVIPELEHVVTEAVGRLN